MTSTVQRTTIIVQVQSCIVVCTVLIMHLCIVFSAEFSLRTFAVESPHHAAAASMSSPVSMDVDQQQPPAPDAQEIAYPEASGRQSAEAAGNVLPDGSTPMTTFECKIQVGNEAENEVLCLSRHR